MQFFLKSHFFLQKYYLVDDHENKNGDNLTREKFQICSPKFWDKLQTLWILCGHRVLMRNMAIFIPIQVRVNEPEMVKI